MESYFWLQIFSLTLMCVFLPGDLFLYQFNRMLGLDMLPAFSSSVTLRLVTAYVALALVSNNLLCLPDDHAVELVEKQIAGQWKKLLDDEE